jgi:hypothetical protein
MPGSIRFLPARDQIRPTIAVVVLYDVGGASVPNSEVVVAGCQVADAVIDQRRQPAGGHCSAIAILPDLQQVTTAVAVEVGGVEHLIQPGFTEGGIAPVVECVALAAPERELHLPVVGFRDPQHVAARIAIGIGREHAHVPRPDPEKLLA